MKDKNKGYKPWKNYGGKFDNDEKELEKKAKEHEVKRREKLKPLVDKITEVYMKEHRKNVLNDPRKAKPQYMREDPTTPLIREVPFGPDTKGRLLDPDDERYVNAKPHWENDKIVWAGDLRHYDIPSQNMAEFNKFEAEQNKLPPSKAFPLHFSNGVGFRVIPHGDISIPKEQERKTLPFEKRNWEHGKLKAKAKRSHQSDDDAEAIAKELLLNEGSSRFVNKKTKKIRPDKPVRSDFASIITAEKGYEGVVKKETVLIVGEHDKPEYVKVTPLTKSKEPEETCCDCGRSIPLSKLKDHPVICK